MSKIDTYCSERKEIRPSDGEYELTIISMSLGTLYLTVTELYAEITPTVDPVTKPSRLEGFLEDVSLKQRE